jgi:hypothetical protein
MSTRPSSRRVAVNLDRAADIDPTGTNVGPGAAVGDGAAVRTEVGALVPTGPELDDNVGEPTPQAASTVMTMPVRRLRPGIDIALAPVGFIERETR